MIKPHSIKLFVMNLYTVVILSFVWNVTTAALYNSDDRNDKSVKVATFHFPEYAYKETSKNEIIYHEYESACEQHVACLHLLGAAKKACVRRCISYSCYQDIYAFDELEEGEIDVRLNSFKGCVIQRTGNTNSKRM